MNQDSTGYFITLEGIEGAGKTTLAERMEARLREMGRTCLRAREPGGTAAGERLRGLLLHDDLPLAPETEMLVIESARAQLMHEAILPALQRGDTVILDRHCDSTLAYQGFGRGLDLEAIGRVNRFACRGRTPDWTLLLDLPAREGLERARRDAEKAQRPDRFERETLEFLERVRRGFLTLAEREPRRISVIDAGVSMDEVWREVKKTLEERLGAGRADSGG
ncbi:MAG: dTMP kinase [bacterium]|nr:dTMP kinase [bacterium]